MSSIDNQKRWLCCHHLQTATDSACESYRLVCMITPVPTARDVDVIIDSHIQMEQHVSAVCRAAYFQTNAITRIRSSLNQSSAATLALALVISKLDYGHCLLCDLPDSLLRRLQLVQNSATRMVCQVNDHITPALHVVHWLLTDSASSRHTRFCVSSSKHCTVMAPQYLVDVPRHYQSATLLRSASQNKLVKPVSNSGYGDDASVAVGPRLWISLSLLLTGYRPLQSFKRGIRLIVQNRLWRPLTA